MRQQKIVTDESFPTFRTYCSCYDKKGKYHYETQNKRCLYDGKENPKSCFFAGCPRINWEETENLN